MTDAMLIEQFEQCSLPLDQWTHRAHIKVAYLYLRQFPFEEALLKIRNGLQAFIRAKEVPVNGTMGYNETTTHAFMRLIGSTIAAYNIQFPTPNTDAFCDTHPQLMCKHVLRIFYSPERRMHPEAKSRFIEPDLTPLPNCSN
jgi:hypothetical protein